MATKFYGINEIHTTMYTYSETVDENVMYVGVVAQSRTRKTPEDVTLLFSKEQVVKMYEDMLQMEKSNSQYLKK